MKDSIVLKIIGFESLLSNSEAKPSEEINCFTSGTIKDVNDEIMYKAVGRVFGTYSVLSKCRLLIL